MAAVTPGGPAAEAGLEAGDIITDANGVSLASSERRYENPGERFIDIVRELQEYGIETVVNDPVANAEDARREYGVDLVDLATVKSVDAVVFAVAHQAYQAFPIEQLRQLCSDRKGAGVIVDVKNVLDRVAVESAGLVYWNL